jgi:integrase
MASVEKVVRDGRTASQARWRDHQGMQRKKSFTKKGDADRYAATVEADKARGTYVEPSKITVAEYARGWAETRPHRPTTARRTEMMIRLHIEGTRLGGRKLADVRPSEVQAWASDRSRVLAPTTVRQAVGLLRSVYAAAVLDRLVASSPVVRIRLPRHERERVVPLSVEQVSALAEAMPARYRAMVLTQAGLGLRIGELLGLRVEDVDFLRRTVRVEWQFTSGSKERSEPKTPRSRRTIPAPQVVLDAIAGHLATYPAGEDGAVFTTTAGTPLGHVYYGHNLFRRAVASAGLPEGKTSHDGTTSRRCCWPPTSQWSPSPSGSATTTPPSCCPPTAISCRTARTGRGERSMPRGAPREPGVPRMCPRASGRRASRRGRRRPARGRWRPCPCAPRGR